MKKAKTIMWAVYVKGKIRNVYDNEVEARCSADLERDMGYMEEDKRGLAAHVRSVRVRRIEIRVLED